MKHYLNKGSCAPVEYQEQLCTNTGGSSPGKLILPFPCRKHTFKIKASSTQGAIKRSKKSKPHLLADHFQVLCCVRQKASTPRMRAQALLTHKGSTNPSRARAPSCTGAPPKTPHVQELPQPLMGKGPPKSSHARAPSAPSCMRAPQSPSHTRASQTPHAQGPPHAR